MSRYAEKTSVPVEKSRIEIERLLTRRGCRDFAYRSSDRMAQLGFKMNERMVRFDLPMPTVAEFAKTAGEHPKARTAVQAEKAWEQACRQRWRALALVIKAKLEAVDAGITTFEVEFLQHTVIPATGEIVADVALPAVQKAYLTGKMPPLLSG